MSTSTAATTHPRQRAGIRHGYVVAAVHARSQQLRDIVARATARAEETGEPVVFFTAITKRPLSAELTLMRTRLARYVYPVHLVATWVDVASLTPDARARRIAAEIVRAARDLPAAALIIGLDPETELPALSIARQVAVGLPMETELCVGVPDAATSAAQQGDIRLAKAGVG